MNCPSCDYQNREDAKFCRQCGARLERICPRCECKLDLEANFCDECGYNLKLDAAAEPRPKLVEEVIKELQDNILGFIPKKLAEKILNDRASIEGERKQITVLFADVSGFTAMSERLDPEEVVTIMNGCFQIIIEEVNRYEGVINQFTGDGVMALFGAPIALEDHAYRAVSSALAIQRSLDKYSDKIKKEIGINLKIRIGINTGLVVVGRIGSDLRMDYTATGDTTNLASRLESLAEPGKVFISDSTYKLVQDYFDVKSLGHVAVKGRTSPVMAYRVKGIKRSIDPVYIAKGLTKFIGRHNELEIICERLDRIKEGSGQIVGIVGEAGIGKTRLIYELRKLIKNQKITYIESRCASFGWTTPYLPIIDHIKSNFGIAAIDDESTIKKKIDSEVERMKAGLEWTLPYIYNLLSLKESEGFLGDLDEKEKKRRTHESLRSLYLQGSKIRPLVITIENVHWMDNASGEFLTYLGDVIHGHALLLILTYRPGYSNPFTDKSYYTQIPLNRLTKRESGQLIEEKFDRKEIPSKFVKLIINQADGNPFFLEEIIHSVREEGVLRSENGKYYLTKDLSELKIPDKIQNVITARIDRLDESLKRTLQYASVLGREIPLNLLRKMPDIGNTLESDLSKLIGLEFIYEKSFFPERSYLFKHALTQDVAYQSLLIKKRRELHEVIGDAIKELYEHRLEEYYTILAYHYKNSDNKEKALYYLTLAGDKAVGLYSHIEAKSYYEEALELLQRLPKNKENRIRTNDLIVKLVRELIYYETAKTCLKLLGEAEKLAEELNDNNRLAKIYYLMGITIYMLENPDIGIKFANRCLEIAKKTGDDKLIASAYYVLSSLYFKKGYFPRSIELFREGISLNRRLGNLQAVIHSLGLIGVSYSWIGNLDTGRECISESIIMAQELGEARRIASGHYYLGAVCAMYGQLEEGIENLEKSINLFEESGDVFYSLLPKGFLGYGYVKLGKTKKGIELLEKNLLMIGEKKGPPLWFEALFHAFLGESYLRQGDISKALNYATKALNLARKHGNKFEELHACQTLGMIYTQKGPTFLKKGKGLLNKSVEIIKETGAAGRFAYSYFALGLLYEEQGQGDKAKDYLEKAIPLFEKLKDEGSLGRVYKELTTIKRDVLQGATLI
jgi:class 3 adenylate cyclase/tetratricopeptide (TPR) repeat protein